MKPNFALSLSFEGIRLLHRAAGGWRVVGEVALDAADMPGELAVLRRTATALEPGGLRTKLLLPTEQIKYLTIDTKDLDEDARMDAARAALDGATPYPVEDLAFDISADGAQTHVAAVARETLAEAEAFATEHRFHPTSFATVPSDSPYLGEPFFGPTRASAALLEPGEEVEPDGIAVVVIGDARLPAEVTAEEDIDEVQEEVSTEEAAAEDELVAEVAADDVKDDAQGIDTEEDISEEIEANLVEDAQPDEGADADHGVKDVLETAEDKAESADQGPLEADIDDPSSEVEAEELVSSAEERAAESAPVEIVPPTPEPDAEPKPEPISAETDEDTSVSAAVIPTLPSLGAASRTPPPSSGAAPDVAAPTGFASRRNAAKADARVEPVVSAPSLPIEADPSLPPAPQPFTTHETNAPAPVPPAPREGFLSRRKAKVPPAVGAAAGPAASPQMAGSEAERMTVFGARRDIGGKPRFLGLMLTAALLVFLAGVAAWASVFLDDGLNLSRLFGDRAPRAEAAAPAAPETPLIEQATDIQTPQVEAPQVQTASLTPTLSAEDNAVLDALSVPAQPRRDAPSDEELDAGYAATGIWPRAPVVPPEPAGLISLDDLYVTSIDPVSTANDAVALPRFDSFVTDVALGKVATPAAAGTVFKLDDQGLVIATVEGALSPDGFTVYLGRPDLIPPPTPVRFQAVPDRDPARLALIAARPKARPGDLAERNERANLDGLTRSELAGFRPQLRPQSVQQQAEAAAAAAASVDTNDAVEAALSTPEVTNSFDNATQLAIRASLRPDTRPRNFDRIVKRAQRAPAPQAETRVAAVAPRVVTPKIPSSASVAKQATVRNAINLRKVNLIGVYGKPSSRRALVRLANGRYKKVVVGDRIDGGRVSAIGDSELRYSKGGRSVVLKMPRG